MNRVCVLLFASAAIGFGASRAGEMAAPQQAAIDRISADSMRGNLSFLASDALEGRGTPSNGLDVAAEFIASQFRRAGLEPAGKDGSYFQPANFAVVTPKLDEFRMTLVSKGEELELTPADVGIHSLMRLDFSNTPVIVLPSNGAIPPVEGRVVAGNAGRYGSESSLRMLQARKPALILLISHHAGEPQETEYLEDTDAANAPVLRIINEDAVSAVAEKRTLSVSVHLAAPLRRDVVLRNVAGILRGSDPALRDRFVIVSSHYDHLGVRAGGSGDKIYNGANDNGSGTVSVMEIASALATLQVHPRRSILFLTLFGEEEGLLGSYYYIEHPLVPLRNSVADINLEMLGRTDDPAGPEVGAFAFTGPSYSDLASGMAAAAKAQGVKVYTKNDAASFFDRSDNYAFALAGIVAHTVIVAFDYPDYHAATDEWQKIDYANMAKVDRALAAGILDVANADEVPHWSNSRDAALYREAGR